MIERSDDELRAMIRQAVARRLGAGDGADGAAHAPTLAAHVSHFRYLLPESDGPCIIEPSVPCTHCGYCQSHGH